MPRIKPIRWGDGRDRERRNWSWHRKSGWHRHTVWHRHSRRKHSWC
jgi:hypothetical protein